jgi:hypothetical protein
MMLSNRLAAVVFACAMLLGCVATVSPETENDPEGLAAGEHEVPSSPGEALHPTSAPAGGDIPACDCTADSDCKKGKHCLVYTYCGLCM